MAKKYLCQNSVFSQTGILHFFLKKNVEVQFQNPRSFLEKRTTKKKQMHKKYFSLVNSCDSYAEDCKLQGERSSIKQPNLFFLF